MKSYKKVFKKIFSLFMSAVIIVGLVPAMPAVTVNASASSSLSEVGVKSRIQLQTNTTITPNRTLYEIYPTAKITETSNYTVNSRASGSYLFQFTTTVDPNWDKFDADMSIVYLDTSGNLKYTTLFNLTDAAQSFLGHGDELRVGQNEMFSVKLGSDCKQIVGLFIRKQSDGAYDNNAWKFQYMNVYKTTEIGDVITDGNDQKTRPYCGEFVGRISTVDCNMGYLATMDEYQEWLYPLENSKLTPNKFPEGHVVTSQYMLDILMGDQSFSNENGKVNITINYTNLDGATNNKHIQVNHRTHKDTYFVDYVKRLDEDDDDEETFFRIPVNTHSNTSGKAFTEVSKATLFSGVSWDNSPVEDIGMIACYLTGNYMDAEFYDNRVFANKYSSFNIKFDVLDGIKSVNSISIQSSNISATSAQALTLYKITDFNGDLYYNAGLSEQLVPDWKGYAIAESTGAVHLNSDVISTQNNNLINLEPANQVYVDNRGTTVGIGVAFSDIAGAGLDLYNKPIRTFAHSSSTFKNIGDTLEDYISEGINEEYDKDDSTKYLVELWGLLDEYITLIDIAFSSEDYDYAKYPNQYLQFLVNYGKMVTPKNGLNSNLSKEVRSSAHWPFVINGYYYDSLYLTVDYTDIMGNNRKVTVPFTTAYLVQSNSDDTLFPSGYNPQDTICGFANQGQELGLRLPLSQFKELNSISLEFLDKTYAKGKIENLNDSVYCYFKTIVLGAYMDDIFSISPDEEVSIRAINYYGEVDKNSLRSTFDYGKGYIETIVNVPDSQTVNYMPINSFGDEKNGVTLSRNGSISFTKNDTEKGRFEYKDDLENTYIAKLNYQLESDSEFLNRFGTSSEVNFTIHYTNESGQKRETDLMNMIVNSHDIYGDRQYEHISKVSIPKDDSTLSDFEVTSENYDYTYLSNTGLFLLDNATGYLKFEIDDNVRSVDAITFDLSPSNELPYGTVWQVNSVEVQKLTDISQIYASYGEKVLNADLPHYYRNFEGEKIAYANSPVMFTQENGYSKKINFITINEDGTENIPETGATEDTDKYLTTIPSSMTYEQVSQYLGLSVPKCEYTVNVNVADLPDAGSNNHFYFQLLFKNGKSAVVLANQQLAADGFRQGTTETFRIKTTQNYGELIGVKVVCDTTSSDAQSFDKLNIASIDVLMTNSGIGKRWTVGNVGWVDIAYLEEAVAEAYNANDVLKLSNSQISKDYPVTSSGNVIDLLFTFNFNNANRSKANVNARLVYIDTQRKEVTLEFSLTDKLMEYVDGKASTVYPNLNKMVLSLSDVSSIKRIDLYSEDSGFNINVASIAVEQVIGLGDLYAVSSSHYERYIDELIPITYSTNSASLSGTSLQSISFAQNSISVDTTGSEWGSSISRLPTVNDYSINMYLFGGTLLGVENQFSEKTTDFRVLINHRTLFNSNSIKSTRAIVDGYGVVNGKPCKYIKNFEINDLATIESLTVTTAQIEGNQPVLGYAYVEVVNNGVIVDTLYFDFANSYVINEVMGYPSRNVAVHNEYRQTVHLMLKPEQSGILVEDEANVAVAFRYTSELDPATAKHVYQSPFVFLTDISVSDLSRHLAIEVPFSVTGVDEIVSVVVQTSGPIVEFENALAINYYNNAEKSVKSVAHITDSFTASTQIKVAEKTKKKNTVSAVTLEIVTPSEIDVEGAGYNGKIGMTFNYTDIYNSPRSITIEDITPYIIGSTGPMDTATVKLLVNNIITIDSVALSVDNKLDPWYVTTVTAYELKEDGTIATTSGSANSWIEYGTAVTVNFTPVDPEAIPEDAAVTAISLDASAKLSDNRINVESGSNQILDVYPGDTVKLIAEVEGTGAYNSTVNWSYSESFGTYTTSGSTVTVNVPENAAIDSTGVFTVTSAADSSFTASVTLRVVKNTTPVVETQEYKIEVIADDEEVYNKTLRETTTETINVRGGQTVNVNVTTANTTDSITWQIPANVSTVFETTASGEKVVVNGNNLSFKLKDFTKNVTDADKLVLTGTYKSGDITHTITFTFVPVKNEFVTIEHFDNSTEVSPSHGVITLATATIDELNASKVYTYEMDDYLKVTLLTDYGKVITSKGTIIPDSDPTDDKQDNVLNLKFTDIADSDGTFSFVVKDDEDNEILTFNSKATCNIMTIDHFDSNGTKKVDTKTLDSASQLNLFEYSYEKDDYLVVTMLPNSGSITNSTSAFTLNVSHNKAKLPFTKFDANGELSFTYVDSLGTEIAIFNCKASNIDIMKVEHFNSSGTSKGVQTLTTANAQALYDYSYAAGDYIVVTMLADFGSIKNSKDTSTLTPSSNISANLKFADIADENGNFSFTYLDGSGNEVISFNGKATPATP